MEMSDSKIQRCSSHGDLYMSCLKTNKSKNEPIETSFALLTTNVLNLAERVRETSENDKEKIQVQATEVASLRKENQVLRIKVVELQNDAKKHTEEYKALHTQLMQTAEETKRLKNIEKMYLKRKSYFDMLTKTHENEKRQMQETIKEQNDKIQLQQRAESTVRDQLSRTGEEIDDSNTSQSSENANIPELSDINRPTRLGEKYQEIYDNEWTEAFECLTESEHGSTQPISDLLNILMETNSFCEKEAEKQLEAIQQALTQDRSKMQEDSRKQICFTRINNKLKECRKAIAVFSGDQVYKNYLDELKHSNTETARKAQTVPHFLEACLKLCWLMAVQDPPLVFSPNIGRGDVFDTELYKVYLKKGTRVAYVVWPALLQHKEGEVICKGVAEGMPNLFHQPQDVPTPYHKGNLTRHYTSTFSNQYYKRTDYMLEVGNEKNENNPTGGEKYSLSEITGNKCDASFRLHSYDSTSYYAMASRLHTARKLSSDISDTKQNVQAYRPKSYLGERFYRIEDTPPLYYRSHLDSSWVRSNTSPHRQLKPNNTQARHKTEQSSGNEENQESNNN